MNATHSPFVYGAYPAPKAKRSVLSPVPSHVRHVATKVGVIVAGFAALGYLMAVSFARMG